MFVTSWFLYGGPFFDPNFLGIIVVLSAMWHSSFVVMMVVAVHRIYLIKKHRR